MSSAFRVFFSFLYILIRAVGSVSGVCYARVGILQLRLLSLSRQSNPSILTAGLLPKLARTQDPPFLEEDDGESDSPGGIERGETGMNFSSPNRSSWISGLDTLLGGDPQKKGGDEATWALVCSAP